MLSRQAVRHAHHAARKAPAPAKELSTKVPSGLTVSSIENHGAVSQLVLAFRAGSRYETAAQSGLVHHLRNAVGKDSNKYGGDPLMFNHAQVGGDLSSFATRDVFGVLVTVPRDHTSMALSVLGHLAADPAFKPWDLEEVASTMLTDNSYKTAYDVLLEDIHRAAYRNGPLANSVFAGKRNIGKYTHDDLTAFADKHLVSGGAVLYGANIDQEALTIYGDSHVPIRQGAAVAAPASQFYGGEYRRESAGQYAHVILAGEGASACDASAMAAQAVVLAALGRGPNTKYSGAPGQGCVSKALAGKAAVSGVSAAYTGSGLAGVYIVAEAEQAGAAVKQAVHALKGFNAGDIEAAKARAKLDILRSSAHSAQSAVDRAIQILAGVDAGAVVKAIDQVTASSVNAAAKKLTEKLSIASYGNISQVPYRDQL